jgi:4-diphosphocytidyl-2-C-methyl-D-erythritol kinase
MQTIDLFDTITLEKSDHLEFSCNDPAIPSDENNLAFRAALEFRSEYYFPGVTIDLVKKIPHGSGLGGGSSNAAFVLRGLIKLFGLGPDPAVLARIALGIGSDVPFFLSTGQSLVEGRGERLSRVDLPLNYEVVVISPPVTVSTAEAYNSLKNGLTSGPGPNLLSKQIDLSRLVRLSREFKNDLEIPTLAKHQDLLDLKRSLLGAGAFFSSMTGSGSSYFGLFAGGTRLAGKFESQKESGHKVFYCKPILLPPTL